MSLVRFGRGPARLSVIRRLIFALTALAISLGLASPSYSQVVTDTRSEYRLNAGDALEIFIWSEERMQREVRVLPDGTFAFPLAGTIHAEGKTAREVGTEIQSRIGQYYRGGTPEVTVSVKDTSGMRFYVIGKVRSPGSYSVGRTINALQALTLAGGPAEFANLDKAIILRETLTGNTVERISLADVLKGARALDAGEQPQTIPLLRSGDVLVIP